MNGSQFPFHPSPFSPVKGANAELFNDTTCTHTHVCIDIHAYARATANFNGGM